LIGGLRRSFVGEASLAYADSRRIAERHELLSESSFRREKKRSKNGPENEALHMEKIDSFSRVDFQRDTYK
jgi:hypothetical protein